MNWSRTFRFRLAMRFVSLTLFCVLCVVGLAFFPSAPLTQVKAASSSLYDPGPGKTLQLIGQDYTSDYQDYVTATGLAPAGGSLYGDIYSGGLDSSSQALLNYIGTTYPNAYVEAGMSWKDALAQNGYTGYAAGYTMELDIVNHKYDSQIDSWASLLKKWPRLKFLLRLDYEVSLNIHANSNPNALDPSSFKPQAYQNAFNYVAARIRNEDQVSNVAFVYHPVRGITDAQELYPGSQYVDWIGVSVFNNDVCLDDNGTSNCTGQQIDPNLAQVLQFGQKQGKPLMISESSVQSPYDSTSSGFENYLGRVFSIINTYDIRAFAYINYNWATHGWTGGFANTDARVQRDPTVLSYWLQTLSSPRYITYSGSGGTPDPDADTSREHTDCNSYFWRQ